MDLTKAIVYNGFTAQPPTPSASSPLSGVQFTRVRMSQVDGFGFTDKKALADGLDAIDVFLGGRVVDIDAAVYGSSYADLMDRVREVTAAFSPTIAYAANTANRGFIPLDYFSPTVNVSFSTSSFPNGIPLRMYLRPIDAPMYDLDKDRLAGEVTKGGAIPMRIRMLARDPRQYLQTQTSIAVTTATQTLQHRGTYPSPPTFNWTMSGAGSSDFVIDLDGFSVKLDLSVVSTGSFSLSFQDGHITDANGSSRDDLFKAGFEHEFAEVQPESASYVRAFNTSNTSNRTLVWREAWL